MRWDRLFLVLVLLGVYFAWRGPVGPSLTPMQWPNALLLLSAWLGSAVAYVQMMRAML